MKKHKKIVVGFCISILACLGVLSIFHPDSVSALNKQPINFYYSSCVDNIVGNTGGTNCTFFAPGNINPNLLYGHGDFELQYVETLLFQVPYSKDGYTLQNPPSRITLVDPDTLKAAGNNPLRDANFAYTGQHGDSTSTKTDTFIYKPSGAGSDQRFALLVGMRTDGTPHIFALVNDQVQNDPRGDDRGTVYAYNIDRDANSSNADGTLVAATGSTDEAKGTCESNFAFSFSWLICPLLSLADGAAGAFNSFVEGQLCFKTGATSETGGVVCEGKKNLDDNVKKDWSIFKNIASALLIIVMLLVIIAQAVGVESGPFGAYSIRKILPKIVAAVIIMQVSWYLFKYAIDLSNDAGYAIKDLIFAPFGGSDNIDLEKLVGNGVRIATGGTIGATAFELFATLAATAAFVIVIPALPLMALYVVLALFIAFVVLVLRKLLILTLIILAPLALIAWILPGTENYWKLWRDNFIRLVFMFPLVMALLASGRIFAYITGSGNTDGVKGFADLAIIIAAWFAPYFLLPKTFSWGGSLFSASAGAVQKFAMQSSKRPREGLKEVEKGWREQRRRDSMERVAQGRPRRFTSVDMFRSGQWNPLLGFSAETNRRLGLHKVPGLKNARFVQEGSRRRNRQTQSYIEQGEKLEQEYINAAEAKLVRERQAHRAKGGQHDVYLQAIASGLREFTDPNTGEKVELGIRSKAERDAARKQLAKLGAGMNYRYLDNYHASTMNELREARASGDSGRIRQAETEAAEMRKFFDDNVDTILPKLPHIYKSIGQAADADPSAIAGMHGVEIEAILSDLTRQINESATPHGRQTAQGQLTKFLHNFQRAVDNSERGGPQLENGALRAVKGFLTHDGSVAHELLDGENGINTEEFHGREGRGRDTIVPGEPHRILRRLENSDTLTFDTNNAQEQQIHADFEGLRASLDTKLNEAGFVSAAGGATGGGGAPAGTLIIPHQQQVIRQRVPEGKLDAPDVTSWTPREDAYAENAVRDEYRQLHDKLGRGAALSDAERQRYEQIRNTFPDLH